MADELTKLREKALALLATRTIDTSKWGKDVKNLLEELSIHQIELEHQNEELSVSHEETKIAVARYIDLFENAPISYIILDINGKILQVNETFCKIFGVKRDNMINMPFYKLIVPTYQDVFYRFYSSLRKGEALAKTELKMNGIGYGEVAVKIDAVFQKTTSNYRLAITDITFLKKLEEQLRLEKENSQKKELHLKQIVESSYEVFFNQDVNTLRIEYVSPRITDMFGFTPEEFTAMKFSDFLQLLLPRYRKGYSSIMEDLVLAEETGSKTLEKEFEILTKGREVKWIRGSYCFAKNKQGLPSQIVGTLQDITVNKHYEQHLIKEKNEADDRNVLRSEYLINMSHKIRTLLNGILGFSSLMKERTVEDDENREYFDIIEKNGDRLLEFMNDIIALSNLETKMLRIKKEVFNFNDILSNCLKYYGPEAHQKGLALINKNDGETTSYLVDTDKEKLASVVNNLVQNAIKFTDKGTVEVGVEITGSKLYFYVKDTGIGISTERQKNLFKRYVKVDEISFNTPVGFGLSVSKGIIDLLGGTIGFDSVEHVGSTFYFTIPYSSVQAEVAIPAYNEPVASRKETDLSSMDVVVAEDDYSAYMLLYEYLLDTKANLIHVSDGDELMSLLDKKVPQLVLLDIHMPHKNGEQCLREIRSRNLPTKVIVQTAFAQDQDREHFLELGADAYISKPIMKTELFKLINGLISADTKA